MFIVSLLWPSGPQNAFVVLNHTAYGMQSLCHSGVRVLDGSDGVVGRLGPPEMTSFGSLVGVVYHYPTLLRLLGFPLPTTGRMSDTTQSSPAPRRHPFVGLLHLIVNSKSGTTCCPPLRSLVAGTHSRPGPTRDDHAPTNYMKREALFSHVNPADSKKIGHHSGSCEESFQFVQCRTQLGCWGTRPSQIKVKKN